MLRFSIIITLLLTLISGYTKAQEVSLFVGMYDIGTQSINSSGNGISTENQRTEFKGNIGTFIDYKKWTLYSEFVITYLNTKSTSRYDEATNLHHSSKHPASTRLRTRIGLGKKIEAANNIRARFISYLGYEYSGIYQNHVYSNYSAETGVLQERKSSELPSEQTIEFGVKCLVEYKCFKSLYVGMGIDFNFYMLNQSGTTKDWHYYLHPGTESSLPGSIYEVTETVHDNSRFGTSFFDVSMYLSYRLWK